MTSSSKDTVRLRFAIDRFEVDHRRSSCRAREGACHTSISVDARMDDGSFAPSAHRVASRSFCLLLVNSRRNNNNKAGVVALLPPFTDRLFRDLETAFPNSLYVHLVLGCYDNY
jgi:hypothetical protein